MEAIWIGILIFVPSAVIIFILALCRSAALADRQFERARIANQRTWSNTPERIETYKDLHLSADTKPVPRLGHSRANS